MAELKNSVELNDVELDEVAGGVKLSSGSIRFKADNGTKGVGNKVLNKIGDSKVAKAVEKGINKHGNKTLLKSMDTGNK